MHDFLEALVGLLELGGDLLLGHSSHPPALTRGMRLVSRKPLELAGRDCSPHAQAFIVRLPRGAHCRVENFDASVWVTPLDSDSASLVPAEYRQAARAYGFLLEVAPGSLEDSFRRTPRK